LYDVKFYRAIRKYKDNLIWEILYRDIPLEKLDSLETKLIKKFDSYSNGYNATTGGYGRAGNPLSKRARTKLSKKYTASGNPFYGKRHSEETKLKMSMSSKGQKAWNKGIGHTKKSKAKMSYSQRLIAEKKGKLSWKMVREIRSSYKSGKYSYDDISIMYGITKGNVGHIINYRIWR